MQDLVHQDLTSAHPLIAEAHGLSASLLQRILWPAPIVAPQEVELSSTCKVARTLTITQGTLGNGGCPATVPQQ